MINEHSQSDREQMTALLKLSEDELLEMISTQLENPWLTPEVADAQLVLVRAQLDADARGKPPAPFAAFHRAMQCLTRRIPIPFSFLDVGCGVGHYGVLCQRHYPLVRYWGTDISREMVYRAIEVNAMANNPQVFWYKTLPFDANDFAAFDVVFVSQALEMTDDPNASLRLVLDRSKEYILLHRLRLTANDEPTQRIDEATYCGYPARNVLWNKVEVLEIAGEYGAVVYADEWDGSLTMIVEK